MGLKNFLSQIEKTLHLKSILILFIVSLLLIQTNLLININEKQNLSILKEKIPEKNINEVVQKSDLNETNLSSILSRLKISALSANSGWKFKRNINLFPSTPTNNYQVKLELNTTNFDYIQADVLGNDLRFYDSSATNLSYWIESWNTTGKSIIWINIPNSGTTNLEMYYGNPQASKQSSGEEVFQFFEDFEGGTLNASKWDNDTDQFNSISIANGKLKILTDSILDQLQYTSIGFQNLTINHGQKSPGYIYVDGITITTRNFWTLAGGIATITQNVIPKATWIIDEIQWINNTRVNLSNETNTIIHSTNIPTLNQKIELFAWDDCSGASCPGGSGSWYGGGIKSLVSFGPGSALRFSYFQNVTYGTPEEPAHLEADWLFVRNIADQDPITSIGAEYEVTSLKLVSDPIYITKNSDFVDLGYSGDGSVNNPYEIQHYYIGNNSHYDSLSQGLIHIENVSVYFKIFNNTLDGINNNKNGIYLKNTKFGTIEGNFISENTINGIFLQNSSNNIIFNNILNHSIIHGIELFQSSQNTISTNNISYNGYRGVYLRENSNDNILSLNLIEYNFQGIVAYLTINNTLIDNQCNYQNHGYIVWTSENTTLVNNSAIGNAFGFYIYLSSNNNSLINNVASNSGTGYYIESNCINNIFDGNIASNSNINDGFYFYNSSNNNTIINNIASFNRGSGFVLRHSHNNTIINNTATNNEQLGIFLAGTSSENSLQDNKALNNGQYGFYIVGPINSLTNNNASSNLLSGFFLINTNSNTLINNVASNNQGSGITLDTSYSNLIYGNNVTNNQQGIYLINASYNSILNNFLVNNLNYGVFLDGPSNKNDIQLNLLLFNSISNTLDNSSVNIWSRNTYSDYQGEEAYLVPGSAGVQDFSPIGLDTDGDMMPDWFEVKYGLNVNGNDSFLDPDNDQLTNYDEYLLRTDPFVNNFGQISNIIVTQTIIDNNLVWIATSSNASTFTIYKDDIPIQSGMWISGSNISFDLSVLSPGTYNFTLVVTDSLEASVSHSVILSLTNLQIPETATYSITDTTYVSLTSITTTFTTMTSQIVETITKTAGTGLAFFLIGLISIFVIHKRRK